ncbi:hypothetical protein MRX96_034356 [Rhipicephalus microplus]
MVLECSDEIDETDAVSSASLSMFRSSSLSNSFTELRRAFFRQGVLFVPCGGGGGGGMAVASDRASVAVGGALTFHCMPDQGCCEVSVVITSAYFLMVSCCCLMDSCISLIVLSSCNILAVSGSFCGFLTGVREHWRVFASFSLLTPPFDDVSPSAIA